MKSQKGLEIRDPIHECIMCSPEEKELINSPLVQRLKWVAQLSLVNQVYNGAVHSRFSHSLGVMKLAGDFMEALLSTYADVDKKRYISIARVAGLLHDIGHGPFSHSFDHQVYYKIYGIEDGGHDIARIKLIQCDMLKPFIEKCGVKVEELLSIWGVLLDTSDTKYLDPMYDIIRNVVEGPLGADRMDFTQRDAYYTGMQHLGTIPSQRLIKNSRIVFLQDGIPRLAYNSKCIYDIIRTLDGRLNLYECVYLHKISMASSLLVEKMLEILSTCPDFFQKVQDPNFFKTLNDMKIFALVTEGNNEEAKKFYQMLMERRLPKMDFECKVFDFSKPYDRRYYVDKFYKGVDTSTFEIVKTRPLSGISENKFDQYDIYFYGKDGNIKRCQDLLDEIHYSVPIQPYYIVRGYTFG